MDGWLVMPLGLGSALAFSVSSTLKHLSAAQVPDAQDLHPRALGRFVRATLSHRLWLSGILADVLGLSLQIVALHLGALAVVQPLLISGLIFALLLRQLHERHVRAREAAWAAVLTAALTGFLLLAGTASQPQTGEVADRTPAVAAGVVGLVLAAACVALGRRRRGGARSAALLGVAVGAVYAATAALLKSLTNVASDHGPLAVLTSWQLYVVIAVGGLGLLLNQLAFQAGPLSASLPAIATVDPLLSITIGVVVYDENIRRGSLPGVGLGALLLVLGVAVIQLTRVEATTVDRDGDEPTRTRGAPGPTGGPPVTLTPAISASAAYDRQTSVPGASRKATNRTTRSDAPARTPPAPATRRSEPVRKAEPPAQD